MSDHSSYRSGEYDVDAARKRIKRRSSGYMSLVLGPILVVGSVIVLIANLQKVGGYPAGDARNEPLFWLAFGGFQVAIILVVVAGNLRARAWRSEAPPTEADRRNPEPGEGNSPVRR